MANYYATGSVSSGTAAHITLIETALTACGWTLHDTAGFGQRIWKSPDVNGVAGINFFIWLAAPGSLGCQVAIDWDPVTHTGLMTSGTATSGGGSTPSGTYYIYANELGFTYYVHASPFTTLWIGQPRTRELLNQTDGMCLSTASMSAGATSVTVSEDLTGRLYVGQMVAIQNFAHDSTSGNASNTELVTITSVSAGSLGFSATSNAYDTGAKIGPPSMLWPLGGVFQGWESYGSGCLQPANQAVGQYAGGNPTAHASQTVFFSPGISVGTPFAELNQPAADGQAMECCIPMAVSITSGDQATGQPVWGWLMAFFATNGTTPAAGTKYTDGVNVFIQPSPAASASGPKLLIGPTGDTPDFATMTRLLPPVIEVSDDIHAIPPSAPTGNAPPSKLNTGLN